MENQRVTSIGWTAVDPFVVYVGSLTSPFSSTNSSIYDELTVNARSDQEENEDEPQMTRRFRLRERRIRLPFFPEPLGRQGVSMEALQTLNVGGEFTISV